MHGHEVNTGGDPVGNGHAASRLVAAPGIGDDEHPIHDGKPLCLPYHHAKLVDKHVVDQLFTSSCSIVCSTTSIGSMNSATAVAPMPVCGHWMLAHMAQIRVNPRQLSVFDLAHNTLTTLKSVGCGANVIDPQFRHALLCVNGESTKGHNNVRDCLLDFVHLADSTSEPQVIGLIASAPGLRPADVLTTALNNVTSAP